MLTMTCPWCEEDQTLALDHVQEPETSFTCPDCGTTVTFMDDPAGALELAA